MNQFILKLRTILLLDKIYIFLLIFATLFSIIFINLVKYETKYSIDQKEFNLKILNYKIDSGKLSMELKSDEKFTSLYYFKDEKEQEEFINKYGIGDTIKVTGTLSKPKNNTIFNSFNYKKYLYNKKIFYIINIEKIKLVKKNKNIFFKIKNYVYKRVNNIDNNEYIYALVLGNTNYIENETNRINGISHLFSLSGLHVSLISLLLIKFINIFRRRKEETLLIYIIVFILLFLFTFITDFKPSLLKSIFLFLLVGINKIYYLYIKPYNLLIIVYAFLVFINPFYIYDVSFLLSITVTFFLLFASNLFQTKNYILKLFFTSLISLLSSVPIVINSFYTINIFSLINNLFFVPYVSYIVFPLSLFSFIFPFLNKILFISTFILEKVSVYASNIKFLSFNFITMSIIEIIIYYILIILIIKKKHIKKSIFLLIIFLIIIYIKPNITSLLNKETSLYFLDVSQGDSALIKTENGKTILIDVGGKIIYEYNDFRKSRKTFNLMKSSLIPFYKSIGISKIDYLFITHGDQDHCGYSKDLVENFSVKKIIINNGKINNCESKLKYERLSKYYKIDNVEVYSLNNNDYNDENKNSIVLFIIINDYKFLFMADADVQTETDIIKKYNLSEIDFLKVGHHGSDTSSDINFLKKINNKYSIISVGENNKYGHPKKETLEKLSNTKIYRTDLDGSIEIKINKNGYKIRTCPP